MKENAGKGSRGIRMVKAYVYSAVLFGLLTLLMGALLRFTSLPDQWIPAYILAVLCISCCFIGLLGGSIHCRRGLIFGFLYAAAFLLLILIVNFALLGFPEGASLLQPRFLLCLLCGGGGGLAGVNLRI